MTRTAGYPLDGAPWARGGAGSGVVEVRSALPPTAVHAPSLVPLCVARYRRLACMILLLGAAGPSRWELRRWDRGAGCGCWAARLVACFAVCCGCVCPAALALLLAVFAL